jgi:phosphatidylserine decarboxylase
VYALARSEVRWFKNWLIGAFMRGYAPVMADAAETDPLAYPSFNAFFTRPLRAGARPLDADARALISPCDGSVSVAGELRGDRLLQAKSHDYTLAALLAAPAWNARFVGGSFATLYLAPYNYHRVHMPLGGRLNAAWYVPGRLFSVNRQTAQRVPGLFARNERVVCAFDGEHGPFIVILVGALFVGSMSTVWHGEITPSRADKGVQTLEPGSPAALWQPRGAELGRFSMGSTVILLLPPGAVRWDSLLQPGVSVRVGGRLGVPGA